MQSLEKKGVPYAIELIGSAAATVVLAHLIKDENTARLLTASVIPPLVAGAMGHKIAARTFIAGSLISLFPFIKDGWPYTAAAVGGIVAWVAGANVKPRPNYDHHDDGGGIDH